MTYMNVGHFFCLKFHYAPSAHGQIQRATVGLVEIAGGYCESRVQSLICTTTFSIVNNVIVQAQFEGNECVSC